MPDRVWRKGIAIVGLAILTLVGLKLGHAYWARATLKLLAEPRGIPPSWDAYEAYIDSAFTIGMTRDEVFEAAAEIGPFSVHPRVHLRSEVIEFNLGAMGFPPLMHKKYRVRVIYYDDSGKVYKVYKSEYPAIEVNIQATP